MYLATVIDCHTKAVIGWAIDDNYKTPLITTAIGMAARNHVGLRPDDRREDLFPIDHPCQAPKR